MKHSTHQYEHQIWQLADFYDILQLGEASETLMDYASHVAPLQLEIATKSGTRNITVPSVDVPNTATLYKNLSAMLTASGNTGSLTIDYADQARDYKAGFLPVVLDIQNGTVTTTCIPPVDSANDEFTDYNERGISRALKQAFAADTGFHQSPKFPAIFEHMAKVIPGYKRPTAL